MTGGSASVSLSFDPYGDPENTTVDVGFGYRGELQVGDMVYLRFRDLDAGLGRFTTIDPISGVPGTTTVANQYAYANNDPIGSIDPWGLRPIDIDFDGIDPDEPGIFGLPSAPIPGSAPDWLIERALDALDEFLVAVTVAPVRGVCGDATLDAIAAVQFQGCLLDDGDVLAGASFLAAGGGGGLPPFVAAFSWNASYIVSNAWDVEEFAGPVLCVGVGAGGGLLLPVGGVEVCFGLIADVGPAIDEASFERLDRRVVSFAGSVGVGIGALVTGRMIRGETFVDPWWDYPNLLSYMIPSPLELAGATPPRLVRP